jgi:hypothetical protein
LCFSEIKGFYSKPPTLVFVKCVHLVRLPQRVGKNRLLQCLRHTAYTSRCKCARPDASAAGGTAAAARIGLHVFDFSSGNQLLPSPLLRDECNHVSVKAVCCCDRRQTQKNRVPDQTAVDWTVWTERARQRDIEKGNYVTMHLCRHRFAI